MIPPASRHDLEYEGAGQWWSWHPARAEVVAQRHHGELMAVFKLLGRVTRATKAPAALAG